MKKLYVLILGIILGFSSFCQEFSFTMYFEDAVGNKDTLIFGYDINGTDTVDAIFGEVNIVDVPLDNDFDVRISNLWSKINNSGITQSDIQTKIQILPDSCMGWWFPKQNIDIKCNNWPVTATWDNTLFNTECIEGSVFTSFFPGGWWDVVGHPSNLNRIVLADINHVVFTSNKEEIGYDENYSYINSFGDTIPVFWQAFGDLSLISLKLDDINKDIDIAIFPNPTTGKISLELDDTYTDIQIKVRTIEGKLVQVIEEVNESNINFEINGSAGMYFIEVISKEERVVFKVVKE